MRHRPSTTAYELVPLASLWKDQPERKDQVLAGLITDMAERFHPDHALEVMASGLYTPAAALAVSLEAPGDITALVVRGRVDAVFGCAPMETVPGGGIVWLLATDAVRKYRELMFRAGPVVIAHYLEQFVAITNFVDARFTAALRWAKFLGFEILPAKPHGKLGLPFHQIILKRS
jgi:hypothetical protein